MLTKLTLRAVPVGNRAYKWLFSLSLIVSLWYNAAAQQMQMQLLNGDFPVASRTAVATDTSYWLEAECATLGANWLTKNDPIASNLQYVFVLGKRFNSLSIPPADVAENKVVFNVNVAESGTYYLFARVKGPGPYDDSFWVRLNEGDWINWSEGLNTGAAFAWKRLPGDAMNLQQGNNVVEFAFRENGTGLDKIVLSTKDTIPTGRGAAAINCDSLAPVPDAEGVVRLTLVDATTHVDLMEIKDGSVLDLSQLPAEVNVRANTMPAHVGSVVFELTGATTHRQVETVGLYTLFGDNNGDYQPGAFNTGAHQLTATAYTEGSGGGTAYPAYTVHFTVISGNGLVENENEVKNELEKKAFLNYNNIDLNNIKIYPNPAQQETQLQADFLQMNQPFQAQVLDAFGRIHQTYQWEASEPNQVYSLILNNLAPGMYVVRVIQGKMQRSQKLIVK